MLQVSSGSTRFLSSPHMSGPAGRYSDGAQATPASSVWVLKYYLQTWSSPGEIIT